MKYLLITILILASCSTEKRCANHLKKAKELGCLTMDTVTKYDTIVGFSVDTIFMADSFTSVDTFILIKDNVKTKTVINWKDRIVYQSVLKDTTIVETNYTEFGKWDSLPFSTNKLFNQHILCMISILILID